ncbi:NPC intracellular cholesterol transporter 2-like [Topomyia yanbarensis]|uniref:NPC intracellular cholesterol transporter 2-like n=1 Tax=Topomyia yanbarensis TaxID=2498891 RepID=UPI00273B5819|nr:NPC intracellular cholesterol transporter 2-like [Topomyia yanbarensis]
MNKFAFLVAILPSLVFTEIVPVQECQTGPLPTSVDVIGCSKLPCKLSRGQEAVVYVDFRPASDASALRPSVFATVLGVTVPFSLPEDWQNACDWLVGTRCPLTAGEDVMYVLRLPVQKTYPPVAVDVELRLIDQAEQVVSCFVVSAKVV